METIALINSSPANADSGWVDLETASNDLASHFGLGPEHAECFRANHFCSPECNKHRVAMDVTHRLYHQFLNDLGNSAGVHVLKSKAPQIDPGKGPYAVVLSEKRMLIFCDFLPLVDFLKVERDRIAISLAAGAPLQSPLRTASRL